MVTYDFVNHEMCQPYRIVSVLQCTRLQYDNDTDLHVRHSAMCRWNATHARGMYTHTRMSAYTKHKEEGMLLKFKGGWSYGDKRP